MGARVLCPILGVIVRGGACRLSKILYYLKDNM